MALKEHLHQKQRKQRQQKLKRLLIIVAGTLAVIVFGYYLLNSRGRQSDDLVQREFILQELQAGRYETAVKMIKKSRQADLWAMVADSLDLGFNFNYVPNEPKISGPVGEPVLASNVPYHLLLDSSDSCWVYLYQQRSSGHWIQLFPNPVYSPAQNPLLSGPLRIPAGKQWIFLESDSGQDQIILLAARWPLKHLEQIYARSGETGANDSELRQYLAQHARFARQYAGIVYSEFKFSHKN